MRAGSEGETQLAKRDARANQNEACTCAESLKGVPAHALQSSLEEQTWSWDRNHHRLDLRTS